ncbi:flagellar hook-length control protein FliK [Phyllobacterium leguminum]|uniref:Flagellar hook-length control protein FliK n=1 Tax=Phyllobacterium leguminum TaxID=314237 RepID=A0A318T448_9HYPH|nr:flagellar hook-length control protein FliK [Phyllobacterium leguminum]PYE87689.1 flagellar hook-length control protein FliK [Phyllobacterium leguminum]
MMIKDILAQMQPPARPARTGGKAGLREEREVSAEPKGPADFEALVREIKDKVEKRGSPVPDVMDAYAREETSEKNVADPVPAITVQAVLALDPFFSRQAETTGSRQAEAIGLSEDAGPFTPAPEGKSVRVDRSKEVPTTAPIDGDAVDTKADPKKAAEKNALPTAAPAFPVSEPVAKQRDSAPAAKQRESASATSPVKDEGSVPAPKAEPALRQGRRDDKLEPPTQPDISASPARSVDTPDGKRSVDTGNGERSVDAGNGDRMVPNTPSVSSGVNAPAAPAPAAAVPARPAVHLAGVEIISERSNGVAKTLSIRLQPEELGTVTARLRLVPEGMQVELIADRRETAERLAADREMLGKALQSAGLSDNAVVAVTVTERVSSSTANLAGGQPGQQGFTPQGQSDGGAGGRNGAQMHGQMQEESNGGNRGRRDGRMEPEQQGISSAPAEMPSNRRLSRGLVV